MRKSEVNSEQVTTRADDSPPQERARSNGSYSPDSLDHHSLESADRLDLEAVLPFLEERIAFTMPSELKHLDCVLDYLNERMLRLGIVNAEDSEVLIALDEAIVNAIKHGNKCDPRKAVHIVAEFNAQGVRFTVSDEGNGFERENVPDPTEASRLLEPHGRGLLLINHIMDEVSFNHCGNRLEMFKRPLNRSRSKDRASTNPTDSE